MKQTCGSCVWRDHYISMLGEPGEPAMLFCQFPAARLPLSLQGGPQRERQPVSENATGCPCWAATRGETPMKTGSIPSSWLALTGIMSAAPLLDLLARVDAKRIAHDDLPAVKAEWDRMQST